MASNSWNPRKLKIGDLVTHVLYGREWVGIIINFVEVQHVNINPPEKALVQMQPGTKYECFFKDNAVKRGKVNDSLGLVSINWLFKMVVKNGNTKLARD